jgi:hypothetical protein
MLCAGYRYPRSRVPAKSAESIFALRYGLLATAAVYHELESIPRREWWRTFRDTVEWNTLVTDQLPHHVAIQAAEPVRRSLPLLRHGGDFRKVLQLVADEFEMSRNCELFGGEPWWLRWRTKRAVRREFALSVHYACACLERRRCGCEEVQEISLLDE